MNRAPLHCVCFLCLLTFGLFHQAEAEAHGGFDPVSVTAKNPYLEALKKDEVLQKLFNKYGKDGKMTFDGFQELLERLGLGEVRIVHHEAMIVDHKEGGNGSTNTVSVVDTFGDTDHVHYPHNSDSDEDGDHSGHDGEDHHEESGTSHQDSDHSDQDSHESAMSGAAHSDHDHDHDHEEPTETIKQVPQSPTTTPAPVPAAVQEAPSPRPGRHSSSRRQRRKGKRRQRQRGRKSKVVPTTSSSDLLEITTEPLRRDRRHVGSQTGKEEEEHHDGHDHDDHEEEDEHGHEHEDHDHEHKDDHDEHADHEHEDHDHDDHDHGDHDHEDHDHGDHEDHDHGDHDHDDHDHGDHDDHGHDHNHGDHHHHDHEPGAHCLSAAEILVEYNIPPGMSVMTMPDFMNICPLLITQIDEQACMRHEEDGHDHGEHGEHRGTEMPAAVWGYGILAVTIISILAVLGIVLLPFMEQRVYQFLLCFLVALAVGTLTGDAVLHLLPHALGLHAHDEGGHEGHEGHDEGHDEKGSHLDPVLKGLTVLFGIYFLFIMEKLMGVMTKRRAKRKAKKLRKQKELAHPAESYELKVSTDSPIEDDHCHHHHHHHHHDNEKLKDAGIATMAWMVIMGDGLHNFSDGLAIGAAFASGIPGGVSTSIAVFCHELPHELGDFALLIRAGMSVKQAIFYNLMSACICYIGLLIGLGIGKLSGNVIQFVFAVTAGMFLYVGLVDMLPDMVHPNQPQVIADHDHGDHGEHGHGHNDFSHDNNHGKKKKKQEPVNPVLVQSFGLLVGIGIMLLIAVFEDKIKI